MTFRCKLSRCGSMCKGKYYTDSPLILYILLSNANFVSSSLLYVVVLCLFADWSVEFCKMYTNFVFLRIYVQLDSQKCLNARFSLCVSFSVRLRSIHQKNDIVIWLREQTKRNRKNSLTNKFFRQMKQARARGCLTFCNDFKTICFHDIFIFISQSFVLFVLKGVTYFFFQHENLNKYIKRKTLELIEEICAAIHPLSSIFF